MLKRGPHPVILVPGHGGSVLVHRHVPTRKMFDQEVVYNRWVSSDMLHPKHNLQWSRNISYGVARDPTSSKIIGYKDYNPMIVPYDFGGLKGIQNVAPELNVGLRLTQDITDTYFNHRYFYHLIQHLKHYQIPVSGAPFDFRLILDPSIRAQMWNQLKKHIEDCAERTEQTAILVGHSQGAIITKWFLQDMYMSCPNWVSSHIEGMVLVNGPFGGCPISVRSVIQGAFYIPMMEKHFIQHLDKNSGIIMGLPNTSVYSNRTLFWQQGKESITMDDILEGQKCISFEIWKDLYAPFVSHILQPLPSVDTHMFLSTGVPTDICYRDKDIVYGNGDGIIPDDSLFAYKHANYRHITKNSTHSSSLRDPALLRLVQSVASG